MKEKNIGSPDTPENYVSGRKFDTTLTIEQKHLFFKPSREYKIPDLPLLNEMVNAVKTNRILPDLSKTVFIGVQHMLATTVTLFDSLINLGIKPENMFFSGKCYSNSPIIEDQVRKRGIHLIPANKPKRLGEYQEASEAVLIAMWEKCLDNITIKDIERIIILDDGFRCIETMPKTVPLRYKVAAIEQTRAGLYSSFADYLNYSLIEVASSSAKKILEPPRIAEAVVARVRKLLKDISLDKTKTVIGIVGNGAIGYAICRYFLSQEYDVIVYDENENAFQNISDTRFYKMKTIGSLIANANVIFGCTGKDITEKLDILNIVHTPKTFISCTSEDKEFRTLLRRISQQSLINVDTLSDVSCSSYNGSSIKILQGGFPINFDRTPHSVPAKDIELTRGLLLGACIQAILTATKPIKDGKTVTDGIRQSLNPFIQRFVAIDWLKRQPADRYSEKIFNLFSNVKWIQENSGGQYVKQSELYTVFNQDKMVSIDTPEYTIRAKL